MNAVKLFTAGFHDLVAVIPPGAELAPNTSVKPKSRGKVPGLRRLDGRWFGYNFTEAEAPSLRDARTWDSWRANVGLWALRYPGLDIDIDDEQRAAEITEAAILALGPAPVRRSTQGRRLLVYRTETPFPEFSVETEGGRVEVLSGKRQYLVAGQHPSKQAYRYDGRALWDWPPDELTTVTQEQVREFLATLGNVGTVSTQLAADVDQESLRAPSLDALATLVKRIPNEADRDGYVRMGHAIKAAHDEWPTTFEIWREWCERWTGGTNDPEDIENDWRSFKPPFRIGWGWLQEQVPAVEEFEANSDLENKPEQAQHKGRLRLVSALGIKARAVPWLWEPYVPQGMITLLVGDPGLGKSMLTVRLAALVTRGDLGGSPTPAVLASAEDSWAHTIVPRLEAAGADMSKIFIPQLGDPEFPRGPLLPDDVSMLSTVMQEHGAGLLVIDPLVAHLGNQTDSHNDKSTRSAIAPLHKLAEQTGAAVIGVMHLNKTQVDDVVRRVGGSVGFVGLARSIVLWTRDPEDEDETSAERVMTHAKCNVAPLGPSVKYQIEEQRNGEIVTARVVPTGEAKVSARQALAGKNGAKRNSAKTWLEGVLTAGDVSVSELQELAAAEGYSWGTVRNAKKELPIVARRVGGVGKEGHWVWTLNEFEVSDEHSD